MLIHFSGVISSRGHQQAILHLRQGSLMFPTSVRSASSDLGLVCFHLFGTSCCWLRSNINPADANHHPNTTRINKYGNFSLSVPNLLYVDGDQDPWLYATIHSPLASQYANLSRPELPYGDGILIHEAWHHSDENGLPNLADEPKRIRNVHAEEISVVKGWVKEFYEKKGSWVSVDDREEL